MAATRWSSRKDANKLQMENLIRKALRHFLHPEKSHIMRTCVSSWPPVICAFFVKPQVIIDRHWLEVSLRSEFDDILCNFLYKLSKTLEIRWSQWFVCAVGKSFSQLNVNQRYWENFLIQLWTRWSLQDAGGLLADVGLANATSKWSAEVQTSTCCRWFAMVYYLPDLYSIYIDF